MFRAIFQPPRRDVAGAFLPRRTAFVYDMEDSYVEIPTTLRRSKDDCPKVWCFLACIPFFVAPHLVQMHPLLCIEIPKAVCRSKTSL